MLFEDDWHLVMWELVFHLYFELCTQPVFQYNRLLFRSLICVIVFLMNIGFFPHQNWEKIEI